MNRCTKNGGAARRHFLNICKKTDRGGGRKNCPSPYPAQRGLRHDKCMGPFHRARALFTHGLLSLCMGPFHPSTPQSKIRGAAPGPNVPDLEGLA